MTPSYHRFSFYSLAAVRFNLLIFVCILCCVWAEHMGLIIFIVSIPWYRKWFGTFHQQIKAGIVFKIQYKNYDDACLTYFVLLPTCKRKECLSHSKNILLGQLAIRVNLNYASFVLRIWIFFTKNTFCIALAQICRIN